MVCPRSCCAEIPPMNLAASGHAFRRAGKRYEKRMRLQPLGAQSVRSREPEQIIRAPAMARLKSCPFAQALRDVGSGARLRLDDRFERRFEHAEAFLELVVRDNERHQQPDDVPVAPRRKHDQAVLIAVSHDLLGFPVGGLARLRRAHEFNRLHGAESSYVADKLPALLPLAGASVEPVAEEVRALVEVDADSGGVLESLLEQVEYAQRRLAGQWIPAERAAERADYGDIHQFGAARDRGERESSAERLRHHQKVRLNAVARRSEQAARSPH